MMRGGFLQVDVRLKALLMYDALLESPDTI